MMVLVEYLHVAKNKCKKQDSEFEVLRCMIYACDIVVDSLKQVTPTFLNLESKDLKLVGVIRASQKRITI
jgi:hypothetical protein